jgi:hypothetical protein
VMNVSNAVCSTSKSKKEPKTTIELSRQEENEDAGQVKSHSIRIVAPAAAQAKAQAGRSTLISDKLNSNKKKKASEIMNLEDALKELNIKTTMSESKNRRPCNCQGKPRHA